MADATCDEFYITGYGLRAVIRVVANDVDRIARVARNPLFDSEPAYIDSPS
jgi:hypothetical protein